MNKDVFMKRALALAARARGRTSPNPMVGAVIVKGNKIITQGYHRKAGTPHAEVIALKKAGSEARGATLYVNLEPCCHTEKKTPPCTKLIIESGMKKVVVAMIDPNPKVSGRGIKELKDAGLAVEVGIMEPEVRELNEAFIKFITKKEPFVILKVAQSLDGKIATPTGESRWITGEKSRNYVQKLRNSVDAVLVGIGTVLKDNPSLTSRIPGGRNPYRIIIDSFLRIPLDAKVLIHNSDAKTIIATTRDAEEEKINSLKARGGNILVIKDINGKVDLRALMKELGKLDITSVMIEGGSSINASALQSGIVDKVMFFTAPKIIGGRDAIASIGGEFTGTLKNSIKIRNLKVKKIGEDILLEGYSLKSKHLQ
ncbi:MAG: bifunctional diaminohydroxyphosphoribosylaminopyrimidine deaminase/5-amino-6-(5-phosphoribosylamino)uracil reductase RibD [Nitrospirae bacterium]|nr:bifunctional diaminohydroxyphosphoribosylaminopyrimidine deaminase/5-amino-6-(5-phosphoribosylamino)uracil reductase RibD [Nitrospirota bacterium]